MSRSSRSAALAAAVGLWLLSSLQSVALAQQATWVTTNASGTNFNAIGNWAGSPTFGTSGTFSGLITQASGTLGPFAGVQASQGSLTISNTSNDFTGRPAIIRGTTLTVPMLGMAGSTSPLGRSGTIAVNAGVTQDGGGTLVFAGAADTSDKSFSLVFTIGSFALDSGTGTLNTNFFSSIASGSFAYWVQGAYGSGGDQQQFAVGPAGSLVTYSRLGAFDASLTVQKSVVPQTDTVTGQITQFVVVPEPATLALAAVGVGLAALAIRRRRRHPTTPA